MIRILLDGLRNIPGFRKFWVTTNCSLLLDRVWPEVDVHVLFKPGHYDLLYPGLVLVNRVSCEPWSKRGSCRDYIQDTQRATRIYVRSFTMFHVVGD